MCSSVRAKQAPTQNLCAALAGLIVERVSGEKYVDYVHAHILEPLGMEHTAIGPAHRDNESVRAQREKLMCCAKTGPDAWVSTGRQPHSFQSNQIFSNLPFRKVA